MLRKLMAIIAAMFFGALTAPMQGQASTLTVGGGWTGDDISFVTDSLAFDFTLASAGLFSLTDCCAVGDTWTISGAFGGASAVGASPGGVTLGIGDTFYDQYWSAPTFGHFQVALAAGTYNIFVTGDCVGGCPAGFGVRADLTAVPLPAAGFLLIGALGGMGLVSRRRGRKTA